MFVNEEVCEIALIITSSTNYWFSADSFIELLKSSFELFTIIVGGFHIYNGETMVKDWCRMVFTPEK